MVQINYIAGTIHTCRENASNRQILIRCQPPQIKNLVGLCQPDFLVTSYVSLLIILQLRGVK